MAERSTGLTIQGRLADRPQEPAFLRRSQRSAVGEADEFLPDGYVRTVTTVEVAGAMRDGSGAPRSTQSLDSGEVLVLELEQGVTFVGNADRLRATLRESRPELIGADGQIDLGKLSAPGGPSRSVIGDLIGGLVQRAFSLIVGAAPDAIVEAAKKKVAELLGQKVGQVAELGVTWAGTKALMWAIEKQLKQPPGLYRWTGSTTLEPVDLNHSPPADPARMPMLVFVHGTASSSFGSFAELRNGDAAVWQALESKFTGGIYALEHRTMSESPIDNALALADALPPGARVSLVSHSRGGLVADLLCLAPDHTGLGAAIESYRYRFAGTGDSDAEEAQRVIEEMELAHGEHRTKLAALAARLSHKQLVIERYVRAAAPASGTRLASGNIDVFLSGLLSLIGMVPVFFGSPLYAAFRRVVLEIAKNRTNPHLVPGIEAMLPDSPMATFLRLVEPQGNIRMALLAGDIEGGGVFKRLAVLLTDHLFFESVANDLVVDTPAMLAGVAGKRNARVLFDRGPDVSHFRYFVNQTTRVALRDWLVQPPAVVDDPASAGASPSAPIQLFRALPAPGQFEVALEAARRRDATGADRPVVIMLPGVMGSNLAVGAAAGGRVWFDPIAIARGGLAQLRYEHDDVRVDDLFGLFYGELRDHLGKTHVVVPFAYDWRQPLNVLGERLAAFLRQRLAETQQPIRLLAHSMGGLVVRAAIHRDRKLMDELMARPGARLVMLGTPHQGSHSMVENLIGKGDMLRTLCALDLKHDMQQVLDIVAGFRGPLALLPKPGFVDHLQAAQPGDASEGGQWFRYQNAETWAGFAGKVRDLWFGSGRCARPSQAVLDEAAWLWQADGEARPSLPDEYRDKSVYVFGVARQTPCGVREVNGRLKMVASPHGDGTVTWLSGRIGGIGQYYYMPGVAHGDLLSTARHFPAIVDLLEEGRSGRLDTAPPATRAVEQPEPVIYDAGPPAAADAESAARALIGAAPAQRLESKPRHKLKVTVKAQDLRFVARPIMVGQYERDPIAGPQAVIDTELLDGDLAERLELGLYPGPRGSAVAVLRTPNAQERARGTLTGAVVTGLGELGSALSVPDLTEAVRTGVLRYLLQVVDVLGKADRNELPLATLLIGQNSSANLSVADAVEAVVRGVLEANDRFASVTRLNLRVTDLEIVEIFLDTAITAAYRLRELAPSLTERAKVLGTQLVVGERLEEGRGVRPRLFESRGDNYWPRLIVTDAGRDDAEAPVAAALASPSGGAAPLPTPPAKVIGERLRFLYVGPRARAEAEMLQRQPGFIELLIRRRMADSRWNEDFGRLLFQLMVPPDFKETARSLDRIVLVLDGYTANLPWELMLADDLAGRDTDRKPLALRAPLVRQLTTVRYRNLVRSWAHQQALVIGNPSVEGFTDAFRTAKGGELKPLPALEGAGVEAEEVASVLGSLGFDVHTVIGEEQTATDVLAALYRHPWRILHISAHGVFQQRHRDGHVRSGVVLSDGFLITAAEIKAMESVPELVVLNCCHLGAVDVGHGHDGNQLAASLARELIEMGVRCVVVAGWAVDDRMASRFGQVFYEALLRRGLPFGESVFAAREAAWTENPADITWGAFQAYGDPAWRARRRGTFGGSGSGRFLTAHDVVDFLARAEADIARRSSKLSEREKKSRLEALMAELEERCPEAMRRLPTVQAALGRTLLAFGEMGRASDALGAALRANDSEGRVAVRDAEQLANAESRLGARNDDFEMAARAVRRLEGLARVITAGSGGEHVVGEALNAERASLLAGAYKRQALQYARRLVAGQVEAADTPQVLAELDRLLAASIEAYQHAAKQTPDDAWALQNWLMLQALRSDRLGPDERDATLAEAKRCIDLADQDAKVDRDSPFAATMPCDARLTLCLLQREPWQADPMGEQVLAQLKAQYTEALNSVVFSPRQLDSVASQIRLLAEFIDALGLATPDDPQPVRVAERLHDLARTIDESTPARRVRQPRPAAASSNTAGGAPAAPAGAPPAAQRKAAARKTGTPARKKKT